MKKLDNYDLKLAAGLALRSDMKVVINEVIDRLNLSFEVLQLKEVIFDYDKCFIQFEEDLYILDSIFAFLVACGIFSKKTYQQYFDDLTSMRLLILDRKVR